MRCESILAQREWNETLAVTKTKFRQRMAREGLGEMHARSLCVV